MTQSEQEMQETIKNLLSSQRLAALSTQRNGHPYFDNFLTAPSTAFIKIMVYYYLLVSRFQNVMEYNIRDENDLFT